jgi:Zn-finger nucleic acid-binding protein
VGEVDVEACQACGGLWLERAVFERLSASRERQGAMLGVLPVPGAPPVLGTEPVRYRPCPVCRQFMNRTNYARHSGVILDVCRTHGLWFDRDELRRVLAFIAGGGLDRAREAELEDLREAQRTAAHPPESRAAFFEAAEERNPTGHGLTGAGLMGLAADLAGMFLHKN